MDFGSMCKHAWLCAGLFIVAQAGAFGQTGEPTDSTKAKPTPIAVVDHQVPGVEIALVGIKRASDGTVTATWRYTNRTDKKIELDHGATAGMDSYRFANDAYLSANKTKYTVVTDDRRNPIAAKHDNFAFKVRLGPHESVTTWAKFMAPPPGVEMVTVYLPGAPPIDDVSLQGAKAE